MKFSLYTFIVSALFLSGCTAKYVPPTNGDTANVKFEINSKSYGKMHSFGVFESPLEDESCDNQKLIGSDNWSDTDDVSFGPIKVSAESEFGYKIHYGANPSFGSVALCFSKGAFTPEVDKNYVVKHYVDLQRYSCETKVFVKDNDNLIEISPKVPSIACTQVNGEFFGGTIKVNVTTQ